MEKILYIKANSKPEELSSSLTVGRALINRFIEKNSDYVLEEVDLYKEHIPRPKYNYYSCRSTVISSEELAKLSTEDQNNVRQMIKLCDQFVSATVYVVAAPMWSLSFPAPLKDYLDCVIQVDKTLSFGSDKKPEGLLSDRPRTFIYVQSSGANIPWILKPALNKGMNYVQDIMKFIGISKVEELLVDGTGDSKKEREAAIEKAKLKIDDLL